MGQSKDGGYSKKDTLLPEQLQTLISQLSQSGGNTQAAAEGYKQFLPGGAGGDPIKAQAMKDYQQKTIPSILNAFGSGSKGSTSLNQALASSGADLNTNLASMLSQLQLQASQGIGNLGNAQSQQGLSTPGFAYLQRQPPLWQQLLQTGISAAGEVGKGAAAAGAFSSEKVKENVRDYDKGLDVVKNLDVKIYDYLPIAGGQKDKVGVIAERVPEEIQMEIRGIKAVDLYGLIGLLINSVKELNERIEHLEAV